MAMHRRWQCTNDGDAPTMAMAVKTTTMIGCYQSDLCLVIKPICTLRTPQQEPPIQGAHVVVVVAAAAVVVVLVVLVAHQYDHPTLCSFKSGKF
jgi:hypothetical protein